MTVSEDDPNTFLPGTWEKVEGRFLLGSGVNDNTTYTVGSTGGEATHTIVANELPKISGSFNLRGTTGGYSQIISTSGNMSNSRVSGGGEVTLASSSGQATQVTMSFGNNQAHNNMPPYLVVNIWKRVS